MSILAFGAPGPSEWMLILIIVLVLFGAKKVPELFRGLAQGVNEFRKAREEFEKEMHAAGSEVKNAANPAQPYQPAQNVQPYQPAPAYQQPPVQQPQPQYQPAPGAQPPPVANTPAGNVPVANAPVYQPSPMQPQPAPPYHPNSEPQRTEDRPA